MFEFEKLSFGMGDRFGRQGRIQLSAIEEINRQGSPVVPVWNKSNREHELTGTTQEAVRKEADEAVRANGWKGSYFVDADHITLKNVERFIEFSDFFTIDVAGFIGQKPDAGIKQDFLRRTSGRDLSGFDNQAADYDLNRFADLYLSAIYEVKRVQDHIRTLNPGSFVTEISMDEVPEAQCPPDLFFILRELKYLGIEPNTIAPKFTGLFPKGVDYEGDLLLFEKEFEQDLLILKEVQKQLEFSHEIKLSIHSGSDKFSLYPIIRRLIRKHNSGIHVKTAGTTWLEEVIGLARGGGEGLRIAKEIYHQGMMRFDELSAPYSTVLHIDKEKLPPVKEVLSWSSARLANTLIHDRDCRDFNPHVRQLIHISYKAAAEMGNEFLDALVYYRDPIGEQVYTNLLNRHLQRIF